MAAEDFILQELQTLRTELQNLKRCQLQYFTLSITGTGAVLAFARGMDAPHGAVLLAPLLIILPCWAIFFDKVTTITRIVGYQRTIEKSVRRKDAAYQTYQGFERSLQLYRDYEDPYHGKKLLLSIRHQFWLINWVTYFALSAASLTSAAVNDAHTDHPGIFSFATLVAFLVMALSSHTWWLASKGRYSYKTNEEYWTDLLLNDWRPGDGPGK